MRTAVLTATLLLGALPLHAQTAAPSVATAPPSAEQLVDGMEAAGGRHAGMRRSGAKGLCTTGEWVSTGAGAALSTASTLRAGTRIPVQARFSTSGGNPRAPDNATGGRGLSFTMEGPGGEPHEFVMISAPVFGARTLESFLDALTVRTPDPTTRQVNAAAVAAAAATHPDWAVQPAYYAANPPPVSYATSPFFGVNTFILVAADNTRRPARWTFEPVAGRRALTPEERAALGPDFLQGEFRARVAQAPAEWRVLLQIPQPGDPLLDATAAWPADRPTIEVARLRITAASAVGDAPCEPVMYNPLLLPQGIEPSEDPILLIRAESYAVSLSRRLQ